MKIVYALLAATCLLLGLASTTKAAEPERNCPSREDVIGMIAHKADVQYAGSGLSKWTVWHIAERVSRPVLGEHMSQEQSWLDSFDDREKKELDFCTWLENENYLIDASISFYLERNVICWLIYSLDKNTPDKNWLKMIDGFDDGCVEIIRIARWYARNAHHGTAGHNLYMLIAKLADLLDEREHDAVHSS